MENYANNIIIPRYNDFKLSIDNLKSSFETFNSNPTISNYNDVHNSWLDSYKKWQYVEMFNIGKAEEIMYFNTMNTYPVNQGRIIDNIDNTNFDLSNPNDWSCQGFPGLDYLLHGIGESKSEVVDLYKKNAKYGNYANAVISKMVENTNSVVVNWSSYKSDFISSTNNTATSDFNMLTNDFVYYLRKDLEQIKLVSPLVFFQIFHLTLTLKLTSPLKILLIMFQKTY